MSTKIRVRCNECGNEYDTMPQRILAGHKCKLCAIKERNSSSNHRKTHDEFIMELKEINNNIQLLDEYKTAKTLVRCKCLICGNIWSAKPTNLLTNKTGCPACASISSSLKQSMGLELFISELKNINPNISVIGEYKNSRTNILCRCDLCNNEWMAMPVNLLKGTGCPKHKASHGERFIIEWLSLHDIHYIHQKKFKNLRGVGNRCLPYDFYLPDYNCIIEYQGNFHDHTDRLQSDSDYEIRKQHDNLKKQYAIDNNYAFIEIWYYENIEEKLIEMFNIIDPVTTTA